MTSGPVRLVGGFGSGKTTALQAEAAGCESPLSVSATAAAGPTTFWSLAAAIVGRHRGPVDVLSTPEQRDVVAGLLESEQARDWPTLAGRLGSRDFAVEVADALAHYQASFLGVEELRTHADAAGLSPPWEELAAFSDRYLDHLADRNATDWGGVLARASLLLRGDDVAAAERGRFDRVLVDDFEAASFATHRLLAQLVGPGGCVTVAGNPDAGVWGRWAGSVRWLAQFDRRFGAVEDRRLERAFRPPAVEVAAADLDLAPGSSAVLVADDALVDEVTTSLQSAGVPAVAWPADPWVAPPGVGGVPVAPVTQATSLSWESVLVVAPPDGAPAASAGGSATFDLDLLGGPDLPDEDARAARDAARLDALVRMGRSRATGQIAVQPPSTVTTSPVT